MAVPVLFQSFLFFENKTFIPFEYRDDGLYYVSQNCYEVHDLKFNFSLKFVHDRKEKPLSTASCVSIIL